MALSGAHGDSCREVLDSFSRTAILSFTFTYQFNDTNEVTYQSGQAQNKDCKEQTCLKQPLGHFDSTWPQFIFYGCNEKLPDGRGPCACTDCSQPGCKGAVGPLSL